ncbi:MAG: pyridoxal phosphate-dependent aminotransferase family protein [Cyclobacteriaceae bacterium]|nr:pyridoxal phosphate-dependent aminotransferase family protein [Cyclobacteriaceae bacterium]
MTDLFNKFDMSQSSLGQHADYIEDYFMFPKLEGELGPRMNFNGKPVLNWSLNNYLGLANHPEVRRVDGEAASEWGLAYPMGARMMSGNTVQHIELEREIASFISKEDVMLLNFGYQGVLSIIDAVVDRRDVIVYDAESHASILDGVRLHMGKRFVFPHNNIENLEKQLKRAEKIANETGGGILVITEGVFGMSGNMGSLAEIVVLKEKYNFRLFVDDAHGFGTMGATGAGAGEELGVQDDIDLYFSTFAKSMASIGAFVGGDASVIKYLRYNLRSQIFAKSLPMPLVIGALKRLELLREQPEHKENLWKITNALQSGLKENGFNIGTTQSPVTPVVLSGSVAEACNMVYDLRENYGVFCSMVIYPVIPKGTIILRLIPTAVHTLEDVKETIETFKELKSRLDDGVYLREEILAVTK